MPDLILVDLEDEGTSESSFPKREMLLKGDYMDRVKMFKEGNTSAARFMKPMRLTGTGMTIAVVPAETPGTIDDDSGPGIMPGHGGTGGGSAI